MNKKGFTFVELLAVIVIIGILSTVAVAGVSRHLEKSRTEAFNTMRLSACDDIQNKILNESIVCIPPSYSNCRFGLDTLQNELYLEPLKDPSDDDHICTGEVYVDGIIEADRFDRVDSYDIKVELTCEGYSTVGKDSENCSNLATRDFR